jgi:hypothetical protein
MYQGSLTNISAFEFPFSAFQFSPSASGVRHLPVRYGMKKLIGPTKNIPDSAGEHDDTWKFKKSHLDEPHNFT